MATETTRTRRLLRAAATGVTAVALGYVLTWVLAGTRAARLSVGGALGGAVPDWKVVVWLLFDSHLVGTRTPTIAGPGGPIGGGDLYDTVSILGVEYLYALPVVVLLAAGATVARLARVEHPRAGLAAGATVTVGYLPAVVLLLLLGTAGGVAPSPLRAVAVAGVLYPVALGGLGGAAVGALGGRSGPEGDAAG